MRQASSHSSLKARAARFIDGVFDVFAPRRAFERRAWREASGALHGRYQGASSERPNSAWLGSKGSPDAEVLFDLPVLRERSRDLFQNDGHARAVEQSFLDNVVGTGIKPQARVDWEAIGITEERAHEINRALEREFEVWCKTASADDRLGFAELQAQCMRQVLTNGDVIALPLMLDIEKDRRRKYSLAIEMIEADRLDNPVGVSSTSIRGGVELGDRGQPIRYWIRDSHPGDPWARGAAKWTGYAAFDPDTGRPRVLHAYVQERPGQTRGVPLLTPVLQAFRNLGDYVETELIAAKVAACFTVFVRKANALGAAISRATGTGVDGQREEELGPGRIDYLQDGEEIQTAAPNRPVANFEAFLNRGVVLIGGAIGLPYELLTRDFRQTTYSSARAALLQAWRMFGRWFAFHQCRFDQPIWEQFVEEVYLRGTVPGLPDFYEHRHALTRAHWPRPAWSLIDPEKEITAYQAGIDANLITQAEAVGSISGGNWEELDEQRAREKRKAKELDIEPPAQKPKPALVGAGARDGGNTGGNE